jgi:tetratricopeptide (TPR) repeat protein
LAQAAFSLGTFFWRRGRHQEGETAFASAAQQLTLSPEHSLILAQMWHWQAVFVPVVELRQQLLTQALAQLESTAVSINTIRADKAAILLELGSVTHSQGDHMTAERLYEQSLSLYRIAGDKWGEANALYEMGVSAWSQGHYALAEQRYNQSLQIRRTLQDDIGIAQSLEGLSGSNMFHGHMVKAIDLARQSLAVYRQLEDRVGTAVLQAEVGHKTWCQKLEGLELVEDSLRIFADLGTRHHTAHWTVILAMYKADVDIAEAEPLAESGLALCQEIGYQRGVAIAHGVLSRVAWLHQEYDQAQKMAQIYLHIAEEMNWPLERSDALTWSSWAYLATGDQQQAKCQMYTVLQTPNLWRIAGLDITAVLLSHETPTTAIYQRAWQLIGHGQSRYARHRGAVSLTMLHRFMPEAMMALPAAAIATAKAEGSQLSSAELFADLLTTLQQWSSVNQAV